VRRRCGGCGITYHIPSYIMKQLQKHGNFPECPMCGSKVSSKRDAASMAEVHDVTVQSHL